jgi:UDP:flavonoid glycosyltransferase YjiC (YdhE family)
MTGKRVLLAAEFVRGGATIARLLPLAVALADRGHDVTLALPAELTSAVAAAGFPIVDAPRWSVPPPPGFVALSYADLLMHGGYAAPDALRGLMTGWQQVLHRTTPDLLIADFAPTAMLTARVAGVAMAAVGDGLSLPPLTAPLPTMRPWADVAADALASVEGRILAVINARLGTLQARELRRLRDLFDGVSAFLCTFPELDHYPNRADGIWYGEVFAPSRGPAAVWPAGTGERVYVDLDPRHPALPAIVEALGRLGLPTLVQAGVSQAGGMGARQADAIERGAIQVTTTTNRASVLSGCDMVICQGQEVAVPALLAGKPLLMLPVFVEQMMTVHRVATQGLGYGVEPNADAAAIDAAVRRLVDDRTCRLRSVNFARSYEGYRPGIAVDAVADAIGALIA